VNNHIGSDCFRHVQYPFRALSVIVIDRRKHSLL
jgi:hypothetical protein